MLPQGTLEPDLRLRSVLLLVDATTVVSSSLFVDQPFDVTYVSDLVARMYWIDPA